MKFKILLLLVFSLLISNYCFSDNGKNIKIPDARLQTSSNAEKPEILNQETSSGKITEPDIKRNGALKEKETEIPRKNIEKQKVIKNSLLFFSGFILLLLILVVNRFLLRQRMLGLLREKNMELTRAENALKDLAATKDRLLSIISHDMKNPFNALLSFSESLTDENSKLSDTQIKEYGKQINSAAQQLYKLIETLLEWARAQSGKFEYRFENIDLRNIINENIGILSINAEKKNIQVISFVSNETIVYCDKNTVSIVLRNLLDNAIKFTRFNGEVSISASYKDNFVEIAVKDNGVGMDQNTIDNLFRIDVHKTSVGTSNEYGTGLGLLIVKEFIDKNSGSIRVESKTGEGSTFYFTIPSGSMK